MLKNKIYASFKLIFRSMPPLSISPKSVLEQTLKRSLEQSPPEENFRTSLEFSRTSTLWLLLRHRSSCFVGLFSFLGLLMGLQTPSRKPLYPCIWVQCHKLFEKLIFRS